MKNTKTKNTKYDYNALVKQRKGENEGKRGKQ